MSNFKALEIKDVKGMSFQMFLESFKNKKVLQKQMFKVKMRDNLKEYF